MRHAIVSAPEREHAWAPPRGKRHDIWELRVCSVCDLEDARRWDGSSAWEVTTPCIEPVPSGVTFRALKAELRRHKVRDRPLVVGAPGHWYVGFSLGTIEWHQYPSLPASTIKEGFALLLRWIRARHYDVTRYGPFAEAREHAAACAARCAN